MRGDCTCASTRVPTARRGSRTSTASRTPWPRPCNGSRRTEAAATRRQIAHSVERTGRVRATGADRDFVGRSTRQSRQPAPSRASSAIQALGSPHSMKGRRMVKAVVLYGHPEDPDAFERHYAETHTALAEAVPGLRRFEAARGFATPDDSAVPYQRIAELTFDDMDALQAGMGSSQGQAAVDDLANFASGGVTIFFAEID